MLKRCGTCHHGTVLVVPAPVGRSYRVPARDVLRRSLEELPKGMRAHQFPLPPEESGRMAKAAQEHALALAEISDAWWRPLGRFRGTEVAAGEDRAALGRLEAREAARRARWEREERALRARPRVEDLERAVRDRLGVRTAALLARDEEREGDVGAGGEAGETAEAVAAA